MAMTTIHLMRHGEVFNPQGILYGRLPGYHLSELGQTMAERVATHFSGERSESTPDHVTPERFDVTHVIASPLQRAQETATPIAAAFGLEIHTEERIIEAGNYFEGKTFGVGDGSLRRPQHWPRLINPWRPSWGEAYKEQAARMRAAISDARKLAQGHEAVLVSHQLPIWITRLSFENRRFFHDPRKRECSLASITSLRFDGPDLVGVFYTEPVADLLPGANKVAGA